MISNIDFNFVQQPTPFSCVHSCLSMVTGVPVQTLIDRFGNVGLSFDQEVAVLLENGIFPRVEAASSLALPRGWYIMSTASLNIVGGYHAVVVEVNGEGEFVVHDPNTGRDDVQVYPKDAMSGGRPTMHIVSAVGLDTGTLRLAQSVIPFQTRVRHWLHSCFGHAIASDVVERNHRFLEEALELVQSLGCTSEEAHKLVDYVYGREVGEPSQEVGGVMVTLASLCHASKLNMAVDGEKELARINQPEILEKIREKQKRKPAMSPLPGSYPEREQGLFRKFDVRRVDGSDLPGGKHHGCRYFVLDVDHDPFSKVALGAYANACEYTYGDLAKDLREKWGASTVSGDEKTNLHMLVESARCLGVAQAEGNIDAAEAWSVKVEELFQALTPSSVKAQTLREYADLLDEEDRVCHQEHRDSKSLTYATDRMREEADRLLNTEE